MIPTDLIALGALGFAIVTSIYLHLGGNMRAKQILVFVMTVAIWAWAGYAIGETRGRGWRDAMIRQGCRVICPTPGSKL